MATRFELVARDSSSFWAENCAWARRYSRCHFALLDQRLRQEQAALHGVPAVGRAGHVLLEDAGGILQELNDPRPLLQIKPRLRFPQGPFEAQRRVRVF
jgi:hypothetical protein